MQALIFSAVVISGCSAFVPPFEAEPKNVAVPFHLQIVGFEDKRSDEARGRDDGMRRPFNYHALLEDLQAAFPASPMATETVRARIELEDYLATQGDGGRAMSMRVRFVTAKPVSEAYRFVPAATMVTECHAIQFEEGPDFETRWRRRADYFGNAWTEKDPTELTYRSINGRLWDNLTRECVGQLATAYQQELIKD